jgi:hypothetical protein
MSSKPLTNHLRLIACHVRTETTILSIPDTSPLFGRLVAEDKKSEVTIHSRICRCLALAVRSRDQMCSPQYSFLLVKRQRVFSCSHCLVLLHKCKIPLFGRKETTSNKTDNCESNPNKENYSLCEHFHCCYKRVCNNTYYYSYR